ncbi:SURF1 family protein [Pseudomonas sp. R2.Fl]|nr:SURF1 family protein [Pseudomonas sp. R2.Fl]
MRFWLAVALFPVAMAILLSLGTWQVQRLHWKEALIAEIETRRTAAPVEVADIEAKVAAGEDVDYWAMRASGRFLNDRERHFLATYDGQAGFYVYTPLELADGRYLFVNRGFVPYDNKAPDTRAAGLVAGEQQVTGLARARLAAKPGFLVPDNDPAKNIFYWKDLGAMAATVDLPLDRVLPFFLDADATPVPGGLPRGGVTQIDLPNSHLQYAITWYGLAVALAGVAIAALVRRRA